MNKDRYLIIGGDSIVGQHLKSQYNKRNSQVLYTTRRKDAQGEDMLFLDLSEHNDAWKPPYEFKAIFFCAAITSMDYCQRHKEESRNVNIDNTINIIEKISAHGIPIIYLSSTQVFGTGHYPDESVSVCPVNEYGYQKSKVEEKIIDLGQIHAVARITKVVHKKYSLFKDWVSKLKSGHTIHAFTNYFFSPVSVDFLGEILIRIAEYENRGGIWHVSGNKDISYYDAARIISQTIGVSPGLVKGVDVHEYLENIPVTSSTVLRCNRIISELGVHPPDVVNTIKQVVI